MFGIFKREPSNKNEGPSKKDIEEDIVEPREPGESSDDIYDNQGRSHLEDGEASEGVEAQFFNQGYNELDIEGDYNLEEADGIIDHYNEALEPHEMRELAKKSYYHLVKGETAPGSPIEGVNSLSSKELRVLHDHYLDLLKLENEYDLPYEKEDIQLITDSFEDPVQAEKYLQSISEAHNLVLMAFKNEELTSMSQEDERANSDLVYSTSKSAYEKPEAIKALDSIRNFSNRVIKLRKGKEADDKKKEIIPEFSELDKKLQKSVIDYQKDNRKHSHPRFADGKLLDKGQMDEVAKEVAASEGWQIASFKEKFYKGSRQLVCTQGIGKGKVIKYVFFSKSLKAGKYYINPDVNLHIAKSAKGKDANFAIASVKLLVPTK